MNLADDLEILALMKAAGFIRVFLGIETPVEASLKEAHKLQNTQRSLLDSVRCIQQHGIEVMAGFIVGFDSDPEDVFDRQVAFIQESAIPIAMVGLLEAMPGTQLFRRLRCEGRILSAGNGNNTDCHLNFLPRMNAARLVEGYRNVLHRIYSCDAYYERAKLFLSRCQPQHQRRLSYATVRAFCASVMHQGLLGKARLSYWRFVLTAATRYRRSFGTAMTLAVMGYHFQTLTEQLSKADV